MKFTEQLARRTVIIMLLLTLINLAATWDTLRAVHHVETILRAQADQAAKAAQQINRAASSLCSNSAERCR